MDQIAQKDVLNALLLSGGGGGPSSASASASSYFNPLELFGVDSYLSKWIGYIVDVELFSGHGRSLYFWRYLMYLLEEYKIVEVWTYIDVDNLISQWWHSSENFKSEDPALFSKLRKHETVLDSMLISRHDTVGESSEFFKTSASEFLFFFMKSSPKIRSQSDTLKRQFAICLNYCIHLEQREYKLVKENPDKYLVAAGDYTALGYANNLVYESLAQFSGNLAAKIQKNENIDIVYDDLDGQKHVLSPWMIVYVFMNNFLKRGARSGSLYEAVLAEHPKVVRDWERNADFTLVNHKRYMETAFKCALMQAVLPDLRWYETQGKHSQPLIKIMHAIPQIMEWGAYIDRHGFVDENIERGIQKMVYIIEKEGKNLLQGQPGLRSVLTNPGETGRQILNDVLGAIFQDTVKNLKGAVYSELLRPSRVAEATFPLFLSVYLQSEFLGFSERHTPERAKTLVKSLLYTALPLMASSIYDVQHTLLLYAASPQVGVTRQHSELAASSPSP